jgi:tetratricopeptide (TPR) repeat protein
MVQNITSRYNYIYNANLLLNNYISSLQETYPDNYTEILPVYVAPEKFNAVRENPVHQTPDSSALDEIIRKAKTIIADKSYGIYIDEAYMLLGKSYFYKGDYFIAAEYFEYTASTYQGDKTVLLNALHWKARCYLQLNNLPAAAALLDSLEASVKRVPKHSAEPLATLAQMNIALNRPGTAVSYLEAAIKAHNKVGDKRRWTFILGQLHEAENQPEKALACYKMVQHSNAGFDLYFNARLNAIKLMGMLNTSGKSKTQEMLALVKDEKNADFLDQVYYHVASAYAAADDCPNAIDYYNRSIQAATNNAYQKGLSYLRLADVNFHSTRDYLKAKAYYDSTLRTLPKSHSQYQQIAKKVQNLQYLTDRYQVIAFQDTLQALARLPEGERLRRIQAFASVAEVSSTTPIDSIDARNGKANSGNGRFYFQNEAAMQSGLAGFYKKWGNRIQEDNWRQSIRVADQANTLRTVPVNTPVNATDASAVEETTKDHLQTQRYLKAVPLNANMLQQSNQKIIDAYFELASFYQQELNDNSEAIRIYELLLSRFPDNNYTAAIHYSLYLAYKNTAPDKASTHKGIVLSRFRESIYARNLMDPGFSLKQSEYELALNEKYDSLFTTYQQKDFSAVIQIVADLTSAYPNNRLAPQFEYLKVISIGRRYPVDSLLNAFRTILQHYPADRLIVPLVNEHLSYINQHLDEFKKRKVALLDFDPNEMPFAAPLRAVQTLVPANLPTALPGKKLEVQERIRTPAVSSMFSTAVSDTYYFVIHVADATLRLSTSRFGIGQFNRGNYPARRLRHQITEFDDDQLIYVGNFSSFEDVKTYAEGIIPQLNRIMKVPEPKYTTFIISKENFEKLNSKVLVNEYLDFYKNNY